MTLPTLPVMVLTAPMIAPVFAARPAPMEVPAVAPAWDPALSAASPKASMMDFPTPFIDGTICTYAVARLIAITVSFRHSPRA